MHTGWRSHEVARLKSVGASKLLYVMATVQEYTAPLQARIDPLISGVGPIEAAASLAFVLGRLRSDGVTPDLLVAVGSSGSASLDHAGVYQARSVTYRDMDCSPLGFERGATPFSSGPAILELAPSIPGLRSAALATGASIVSGDGYASLDADMVDMETYAYARVARLSGAPIVALRAISDGRAPLAGYGDWAETLAEIGAGLAHAVDTLEGAVASGALRLGQ